jgi:hypothetical protein
VQVGLGPLDSVDGLAKRVPLANIESGDGFISKCVKADSGTGVGMVLVEAEPPEEACPEVWLVV